VERDPSPAPAESIGALLCRLRLARGYTQLRLAELLCAASGVPTVTRHEVSRWEREERVPGGFWLGWLAAVLDVPLDDLEIAVGATAIERAPAPARGVSGGGLLPLAHAWLVQPPGTLPPATLASLGRTAEPTARGPTNRGSAAGAKTAGAKTAGAKTAGAHATGPADPVALLADLRRMDDLVGGLDLAGRVGATLHAVAASPPTRPGAHRRWLALLGELGQLAGWVAADAADPAGATTAYRIGLRAATAVADRPLAGHILGCASHAVLAFGDPREALLLARTGYEGTRRSASAGGRALLLHRVALAAARCGERRAASTALSAADRVAERRDPGREPAWLYWLDDAELAAMTGRCLVAVGRPLRGLPLLAAATRTDRSAIAPRAAALYAGWMVRAYLDLGEVEEACAVAERLLLDAVRLGSARVAAQATALRHRLAGHTDVPAAVRYARLATEAGPYLPRPTVSGWPGRHAPARGG
jgi:transcriptional regulator with XRE-family HTH domain